MQLAAGVIIGIAFTLLVIGHCGVLELLEQRDRLLRLAQDVIREHEFCGYAKCPGVAIGAMKRYLEGIK